MQTGPRQGADPVVDAGKYRSAMMTPPDSVTRRCASEAILRDRGFAIVPDVIPPDQLPALRGEFDRIMGEADHGCAGARSPLASSSLLRDVSASPNVRRLIEPILDPHAFITRSLLFDKRPGANWDVTWHRDTTIAVKEKHDVSGYGPWSIKAGVHHVRPPVRVLAAMLTVRLHLNDCDADNGGLLVVSGSHAAPNLDLTDSIDAAACQSACVCDPVPRGGAMLMRPLILHASKKAVDPARRRRVVHLEFAANPLDEPMRWNV